MIISADAPILSCLTCAALALASAGLLHAEEFDSAGVKIHYTVAGQGEPVILIHGLTSSARMNWTLPGTTAALAKHYRVIALDCRGHGQSGKPETEGAYGTNMVEDVVRLLDHLHLPKARVAGYSMGGMITMKLLALHPERVSVAVLGGMGWHQAGAPINKLWEWADGGGFFKVPAACLHGFPALAVTEQEVKAVKVPVTVIVGERDPCRQLFVQPLEKIRPDWPVHLIPEAGHVNCVGKPEFKTQLQAALEPR
jgi:pimeloyl-ACP methyl ester carboxylesterase